MGASEINFDGLVGPTHNYAGLSFGNLASMSNQATVSHPMRAALEGLAKMELLAGLGVKQAVLPPHERPHVPTLRKLGFSGDDAAILRRAKEVDPALLASVCSASSMWAANAATVSPSADTRDSRVHFTPANLVSQRHRSIEPEMTGKILRAIFPESAGCFVHHPPLPLAMHFADEGAANHARLAPGSGRAGLEMFVYGRVAENETDAPRKFPARQPLEACQLLAINHMLDPRRVLFVHQSPRAIDGGAFHNDVVAVGHRDLLICSDEAYAANDFARIQDAFRAAAGAELRIVRAELPIDVAVKSYLFNSQLVTLPDHSIALIAPAECEAIAAARNIIELLIEQSAIQSVHFVDVRQSMRNGGGPACLRLRVELSDSELAKCHPGVLWTESLHGKLIDWIGRYYRDELRADDLADPNLLRESREALDALTTILNLGSIYEFQND